jgi:hypothetical protein
MIASTKMGKGFKGVLNYNLKNGSKLLGTNAAGSTLADWLYETKMIRNLRPNLNVAVQHTSINLPTGERLDDEKWLEVANVYMQKMGFDPVANQHWIFRHDDKEHDHIHLVLNRINSVSGEVVSDSNTFRRQSKILREIEAEFGLKELVINPNRKARISKNEIELFDRTGELTPRLKIAQAIDDCIETVKNFEELYQSLTLMGIDVAIKIDEETGEDIGVSFAFENQKYTGGGIGKNYTINALNRRILHEQNRKLERTDKKTIASHADATNITRNEGRTNGTNEKNFNSNVSKSNGSYANTVKQNGASQQSDFRTNLINAEKAKRRKLETERENENRGNAKKDKPTTTNNQNTNSVNNSNNTNSNFNNVEIETMAKKQQKQQQQEVTLEMVKKAREKEEREKAKREKAVEKEEGFKRAETVYEQTKKIQKSWGYSS